MIADQDLVNPKMKKVPKASSMENLCDPNMIQEFSDIRAAKLSDESPLVTSKRI